MILQIVIFFVMLYYHIVLELIGKLCLDSEMINGIEHLNNFSRKKYIMNIKTIIAFTPQCETVNNHIEFYYSHVRNLIVIQERIKFLCLVIIMIAVKFELDDCIRICFDKNVQIFLLFTLQC